MKRKLFEAVWSDCESDAERVNFILAGRAYETGIMSKALQHDVALAFHFRDQVNADTTALKDDIKAILHSRGRRIITWEQQLASINNAIDDWTGGE